MNIFAGIKLFNKANKALKEIKKLKELAPQISEFVEEIIIIFKEFIK